MIGGGEGGLCEVLRERGREGAKKETKRTFLLRPHDGGLGLLCAGEFGAGLLFARCQLY